MQDNFEARNELEEKLHAAQEGQLSSEAPGMIEQLKSNPAH